MKEREAEEAFSRGPASSHKANAVLVGFAAVAAVSAIIGLVLEVLSGKGTKPVGRA
jgi:hypothetical protein